MDNNNNNTPARRARAVSFTVQLIGQEDEEDLPIPPPNTTQSQAPQRRQDSQVPNLLQDVIDRKTTAFQDKLEVLSNALLTALTSSQDNNALNHCAEAINEVCAF